MISKYKVLVISTNPPSYSGNLGGDIIQALEEQGCSVDYLCRYSDNNKTDLNYRSLESKISIRAIIRYCRKILFFFRIIKFFGIIYKVIYDLYYKCNPHKINYLSAKDNSGIRIHYYNEEKPSFSSKKILRAINKKYDFIVTLFWHQFINSTTLRDIYCKYKIPILIYSIDMAHFTGGCQYFNDCRRFEYGCGYCPAFDGNNSHDQTYLNFLTKKKNYDAIKCAFIGNTWVNQFAKNSHLFDGNYIVNISCVIDEKSYIPKSKEEVRKELGIDKTIVLLTRSSHEIRKGCNYAINAIKNIINLLPEKILNNLLIVTIGDSTIGDAIRTLGVSYMEIGFVDKPKLIKLYQAASYFLSTSIDDAGPSMVNQSMMCGTPVICFDNGTAIDVIVNGIDGYKTKDISDKGYLTILYKALMDIDSDNYYRMCCNARNSAIRHNSIKSVGEKLINAYETIK